MEILLLILVGIVMFLITIYVTSRNTLYGLLLYVVFFFSFIFLTNLVGEIRTKRFNSNVSEQIIDYK